MNTIQELHKEYATVSVSFEDKSKCLDLVSGSGFKRITDKAIKKFNEEYSLRVYTHDVSSFQIARSITAEGLGRVVVSCDVKRLDRIEKTFPIEIKADDIDEDDLKFAELYSFADVDKEEFLKSIAVTKAMSQFKALKICNPESDVRLKRVKVKFASAHRYNIEVTFTELPS